MISFENLSADIKGFYCPGLITSQCIQKLIKIPFPKGMIYSFADPIKLIVGNDLMVIHDFLTKIQREGSVLGYRRLLPLISITVNPFYPKYRYESDNYEPSYVNKEQLLENVATLANVPVFDIVNDNCIDLAKIILDYEKLGEHREQSL